MPLIEVQAPKGTLHPSKQDALMSRLSNAVLIAETASPEDPSAQSLVWAYYHEVPKSAVYVGGESQDSAPLTIAVTTPEGAVNDARREALVREIATIVDDLVGPFDGKPNHWAMLYELAEGSWGAGGHIARLADIQAAMNIDTMSV